MEENRYMNRTLITIVCMLLLALLCFGTYKYCEPIEEEETEDCIKTDSSKIWIPTKEDIAYQDSMYSIIRNTQSDIDTIKDNIVYILERLDYKDGTYDSIRYVKRSNKKNKENQSR